MVLYLHVHMYSSCIDMLYAACESVYPDEDEHFACSAGCKTPTIDSTFPNRSHLYIEANSTEVEMIFPPIENTLSYLFNSLFSFSDPINFDDLTEHAHSMELLVVPYLRSDVTILTNDVRLQLIILLYSLYWSIHSLCAGGVQLPGVQF